jgi:hypothetical protein
MSIDVPKHVLPLATEHKHHVTSSFDQNTYKHFKILKTYTFECNAGLFYKCSVSVGTQERIGLAS